MLNDLELSHLGKDNPGMVAVQAKIEEGEGERLSFYKGRKLTLALVFSFKRESDHVSALKANLFSDFQH